MTFISYAQNYEDVMIARALRGVRKGFYIDVGAQDPVEYSVTKAFYEKGWRGINVEPSEYWFTKLERQRPHDINLQVAASDKNGKQHFYNIRDTGLSTTNADYARRHSDAGFVVDEQEITCTTLDDICAENKVDKVHFLKIDCEGAEKSVLEGISLERVRPWIILVESTEPLSETPNFEQWESLLTGRGYHFVYEDGLNRFYVSDEKRDLDKAFSRPPNVFDDFLRVSEYQLREERRLGELAIVERDKWQAMAEFLSGENERREAALVEHRNLLDAAAASEAADRGQLLETIEFLRAENERREAALVEHRKRLDAAATSEAADRGQLLETIEFLRAENERREAVLVEHRKRLDDGAASEAADRSQLLETIEFLRAENERREAALVEYRKQLDDAAATGASDRSQLLGAIEFLRAENESREVILRENRSQLEANTDRLASMAKELRRRCVEVAEAADKMSSYQQELQAQETEMHGLGVEIVRLHSEIAAKGGEISRLNELVQSIYSSTSWRISWPVRACKRAAQALSRMVGFLAYRTFRSTTNFLRALLRWIAQWRWLRSVAVGVAGKNSRLVQRARLFIFGAKMSDSQALELFESKPAVSLGNDSQRIYLRIQAVLLARPYGRSR